ncbi:MAG: tyrosine-type recombinase/integrase [Deltaproteobacteria bacterium]|nr:tyrosine-type recombinase/integrase [Deltaproteobacteria bacterium]
MKDNGKWITRWKTQVAPTRIPGVWKRKEGGHLVRARVVDPTTGKLKEVKKVMPDADEATAFKWLADEKKKIGAGGISEQLPKTRFAEFAASLFEHKVKVGDIRSGSGRQKWADILEHLVGGTTGKSGRHVEGFGEMYIDMIRTAHVDNWKEGVAQLIAARDYAPTTANGWLGVLKVILKAAKRRFSLQHLATEGVDGFDTSEHVTYSEEEPNALTPAEVAPFLERLRELHPEHFAMIYLGLITGLRPSSLRPLRRRGAECDVLWDANRILVRRSHTYQDETMRTTKQKRRYAIDLPAEAMAVLKWHVDTRLETPEQQDSDLLFPSITGGFRSPSVLNRPLADVAEELKLGKKITQRGLRRTFNDLARAAHVNDLVTRSISGHLTEKMQHHYSTVNADEQRSALAKVISLAEARDRKEVA